MQLSIFEIQDVEEPSETPIKINELQPSVKPSVEIIKRFEFDTNIFNCKIEIGKIDNKFDYTLHYHFSTGTYEGCGIPWNHINNRHLFSTKENALSHCKKYFLMRMSHIPERSDTSQAQKNEIPKIIDFINRLFL